VNLCKAAASLLCIPEIIFAGQPFFACSFCHSRALKKMRVSPFWPLNYIVLNDIRWHKTCITISVPLLRSFVPEEVLKVDNRKEKRREHQLYAADVGAQPGREEPLSTGERAAVSGIYQVLHHPHFSEGEIFARKGAVLPSCPVCGEPATFRLVKRIVHINEDPDFQLL
jgi:hypothetical protein